MKKRLAFVLVALFATVAFIACSEETAPSMNTSSAGGTEIIYLETTPAFPGEALEGFL